MNEIEKRQEALIIAITGGIGSGKSTVANILKERGFTVISTDNIAKNVINKNQKIQQKIIETFGNESFIDGVYNTKYISDIVFEDNIFLKEKNANDNLMKLNQIVHPAVIDEMIDEIEILQQNNLQQNNLEIIFVESALIFELELEDGFDYIISVTASSKTRLERIINRTGLNEQQIKSRISHQISQEEKNKNSDFIIENEKGIDELKKSIDFILPIILTLPNKNIGL
jgi:dephospho-CoA kinase